MGYELTLDKISKLYKIDLIIVNESPLSIKSKREYGSVDNPVIRIDVGGRSIPYIPGSSLKGVLRSTAERLAKTLFGDSEDIVCDILDQRSSRYEKNRLDRMKKQNKESDYKPCLICRVFGGPTIGPHIYVSNFYPIDPNKVSVQVVKRVSINRILNAQHASRLFDVEYISPGVEFKGEITIKNIDLEGDSQEAQIVRMLIKLLREGLISLGGGKSVGFGKIKISKMWIYRFDISLNGITKHEVTLNNIGW